MPHKILIVDDEPDILEFVGYNLAKEGYHVLTATDGQQAVDIAVREQPHLILLDRMMPVMDGIQACRILRSTPQTANIHIVFLSALSKEEYQLSGFGAGADDYIPKPVKMNLLKSRINAIMRRIDETAPVTSAPRDSGPEADAEAFVLDAERHILTRRGTIIELPKKEFSLFALLYANAGKIVTREQIYEQVWGTEVVVGTRTIDVHIRRLRRKIGNNHIITVKGVGYKFNN